MSLTAEDSNNCSKRSEKSWKKVGRNADVSVSAKQGHQLWSLQFSTLPVLQRRLVLCLTGTDGYKNRIQTEPEFLHDHTTICHSPSPHSALFEPNLARPRKERKTDYVELDQYEQSLHNRAFTSSRAVSVKIYTSSVCPSQARMGKYDKKTTFLCTDEGSLTKMAV